MADIFGRQALSFGGAFTADGATITFGLYDDPNALTSDEGDGVGLLTQNLQFQYVQPVTRLYEIGSAFCYYIVGRTQGSSSIGRVLGPRPVSAAFYANYGNACHAANNTLVFALAAGCGPNGVSAANNYVITLTGVLLTGIAGSINAGDYVVGEQLSLMFISMLGNNVAT